MTQGSVSFSLISLLPSVSPFHLSVFCLPSLLFTYQSFAFSLLFTYLLPSVSPFNLSVFCLQSPFHLSVFCLQVNTGVQLLKTIRQDLSDTVMVCEAQKKPTNYLRELMSDLAKGTIRGDWKHSTSSKTVKAN